MKTALIEFRSEQDGDAEGKDVAETRELRSGFPRGRTPRVNWDGQMKTYAGSIQAGKRTQQQQTNKQCKVAELRVSM